MLNERTHVNLFQFYFFVPFLKIVYRNWTLITKITFKTATRKENECLKNHENPNNSKITPLKIVKASQSSINSIRMEITQHSKHVHFAFNSNCAADAPKTRLAFSIVEGWEHQPFQAFHWVFFFREKFYAKLIVRRQKKLSRFVCHKLTNSELFVGIRFGKETN